MTESDVRRVVRDEFQKLVAEEHARRMREHEARHEEQLVAEEVRIVSGGRVCQCLTGTPKDRRRARVTAWEVTQRRCNHSAFSGHHRTPSTYSAVRCTRCRASWRTQATYVNMLPDAEDGWSAR